MTSEMIRAAIEKVRQDIQEKRNREETEAVLMRPDSQVACRHAMHWDPEQGMLFVRFETEGTDEFELLEGIERVHETDRVEIRDYKDTSRMAVFCGSRCLGFLPEAIGDLISMLEQEGLFTVEQARIHTLIPVSRRRRYARRAIVFIELHAWIRQPSKEGTEPETAELLKEQVPAEPIELT